MKLPFDTLRRHFTELVIVFVGVVLAFAVENLREDLNEQAAGEQYLMGFREDLSNDLPMLQSQQDSRRGQVESALVALQFFDGRPVDPQQFFEAYYSVLPARSAAPNRNTMDEVLNSGGLGLIRDADIRARLLTLYATYDGIAGSEEHMAREFDSYLYDPTFSSIRFQYQGPWEDTQANRQAVETLLSDFRVENGLRLVVINLGSDESGLVRQLNSARSQVESLLELIPEQ